MARVVFRSEVLLNGEHLLLSTAELRKVVRRLEAEPNSGKPLKRALATYRSIRAQEGDAKRVVFRPTPDGKVVEIVAIGPRTDEEAYNTASGRT